MAEAESRYDAQIALANALDEALPESWGVDSNERVYDSLTELWDDRCEGERTESGWYAHSTAYWTSKDKSTLDGVLGGFTETNSRDIRESRALLEHVLRETPRPRRALDVAGGIGRVTKDLLFEFFDVVDLNDQDAAMLERAREFAASPQLGELVRAPMQDLDPPASHYDCVWLQYCVGYLMDVDLIALLQRLQKSLKPGGAIVLKESVARDGAFWVDNSDSNILRSVDYFEAVFARAGLTVLESRDQRDWPEDMFPLRMFVLR